MNLAIYIMKEIIDNWNHKVQNKKIIIIKFIMNKIIKKSNKMIKVIKRIWEMVINIIMILMILWMNR